MRGRIRSVVRELGKGAGFGEEESDSWAPSRQPKAATKFDSLCFTFTRFVLSMTVGFVHTLWHWRGISGQYSVKTNLGTST